MIKKFAAVVAALALGSVSSTVNAQELQQTESQGWQVIECFSSRDGSWGGCIFLMDDGRIVVVQGPLIHT